MNENVDFVIKNKMCTGCGTCVSMCSRQAIIIDLDNNSGLYQPIIDSNLCNNCGICYNVCPAIEFDFDGIDSKIFGMKSNNSIVGNYINFYVGSSNNKELNQECSSGGVITEVLLFALENKIIDGALVTRMSKDNPLIPEPFIARTKDEIIEASKSKYCPVPLNVILKQIIESDDNEKFAIVGLGCHIQGIRKAQLIMKGLQSKISFCIGIFCSHTDSFLATDYILDWHHIDKDNVSKLDYRGNGWPGSMQIEFKSGSKAEIAYSKYITVHELYLFSPICCSNCIDGISELADISIGDAWGIVSKDKYGKSLCITRSKTGEQMLNDCSQVNNINLTYVGIDKVINSQGLLSRNRLKKARSQLKINRLLGTKSPIYLKADLYLNDFDPAIKNYVQLFIIKVHKKIFEFRCLWPLTYKLLEFEILLMKKLKLKK